VGEGHGSVTTSTQTTVAGSESGRQTEADFQKQILQAARLLGWECYHTTFSLRSSPGFPDLVCAHAGPPARIAVFEVKSERGKVTEHQERWLALFDAVPGVVAKLVRPSDWDELEMTLRGAS
jgi:hypothetical protein